MCTVTPLIAAGDATAKYENVTVVCVESAAGAGLCYCVKTCKHTMKQDLQRSRSQPTALKGTAGQSAKQHKLLCGREQLLGPISA
jgi:hypothetical protein